MQVPFDQIGQSQVGRLVYQVIGKEGPILNPQNIRYLPPDAGKTSVTDVQGLTAGIAGLNLVLSAGTLAVAAYTANASEDIFNMLFISLLAIESRVPLSTIKELNSSMRLTLPLLVTSIAWLMT